MTVSFTNQAIDVSDLPQLAQNDFEEVEPTYLWLRLLVVAGVTAVLLATLAVFSQTVVSLTGLQVAGLLLVVALGFVVAVVCQRLEVSHMGYLLREHDFSFRSGVIRTSVTTMPFSRVQNVAIDRGFVVRVLGLANLRLYSAGGTLHVLGVTYETAEGLKSFIVDRSRIAADQEQVGR